MSSPAVDLRPAGGAPTRTTRFAPGRVLRTYTFAFAGLLALILLIANLLSQESFGWTEQWGAFAPFALVAIASTPAVISGRGGLDISVGPMMIFANIVFVVWLVPAGLGGFVAVPIVLALGAAVGTINGLLIVGLRLQPLVATLGMFFILTGVNLKIAPSPEPVSGSWTEHLAGSIGPVPGGLVVIAVPLLVWFGIVRTSFGRTLFAVGGNDATAYSSGVDVSRVRVAAYALGGLFAAIGGLALTGLVNSADASASGSYTLVAIAAVALGGTSLLGGRGGLIGSVLGAACIYLLQSLLSSLQVSQTWLQVVYGGLLLFAVVLGARLTRTKENA